MAWTVPFYAVPAFKKVVRFLGMSFASFCLHVETNIHNRLHNSNVM